MNQYEKTLFSCLFVYFVLYYGVLQPTVLFLDHQSSFILAFYYFYYFSTVNLIYNKSFFTITKKVSSHYFLNLKDKLTGNTPVH